jgi:uncharacterized protein (DUF302 family)
MVRKEKYGLFTDTLKDFDNALRDLRESLKDEGFGILWEIDVKAIMKTKMNVDYPNYVILGACNPPVAHAALSAEPNIGLLLPCNFIAREENGKVILGGILPDALFGLTGRNDMKEMTDRVEKMIESVLIKVK